MYHTNPFKTDTKHMKPTNQTNEGRKALWDKILKVVIALLSAIAGALGANAMQHM